MYFARHLLFLFFACLNLHARERITAFVSDILVRKNATLLVQEKIEVISERKQIIHGIVREFPTKYRSYANTKHIVNFHLISVTCDGQSVPYWIKSIANGKKIYIGSKNILLAPGKHLYTITYETNRQLGFFKDHDELYWNVTGTGWRLAIDKVEARIRLPADVPMQSVCVQGYTGAQGAQGNFYKSMTSKDSVLITTTYPLRTQEGLTVAVTFAKGFVLEPSSSQKMYWFFSDNFFILLICIGLLLLLILFGGICFVAYGKNKPGVIIPLFYPPKDMTPSVLGCMKAMKFKDLFLSADIVDLAVRGFITIDYVSSQNYSLILKDCVTPFTEQSGATAYDVALLERLFEKNKSLTISKKHNVVITNVLKFCQSYSKSQIHDYIINYQILWFLSCAICLALIILSVDYELIFVAMACVGSLVFASKKFYFMYTVAGRKVQDEIEGFKLYLMAAEVERMKIIGTPPIKTPELYEKYLPYAIALEVEQEWSKQFAPLFKNLENQGHGYQPLWYSGRRFRENNFNLKLTQSLSGTIVSAATPPGRSSGSGGSGRSGGGGGGGGGGGW